ncbi:MAG: hypothetical protein CR971_00670 [candidate division SR1 bacterium]|nr:MAG: hypothetical protein CR971_00670 [candidate division SR1 bacterium]
MTTLTTTLTNATYAFLQEEAKIRKLSKNKVLEEALALYKRLKTKQMIQQSYQQLNTLEDNDEIVTLADQDLDFFTQ